LNREIKHLPNDLTGKKISPPFTKFNLFLGLKNSVTLSTELMMMRFLSWIAKNSNIGKEKNTFLSIGNEKNPVFSFIQY